MRGGAVGGGRQRQIVAVMIHPAPRTRLIQVNAVTPWARSVTAMTTEFKR
jgi:hypothetical protein